MSKLNKLDSIADNAAPWNAQVRADDLKQMAAIMWQMRDALVMYGPYVEEYGFSFGHGNDALAAFDKFDKGE